jgi:hypothetical protein
MTHTFSFHGSLTQYWDVLFAGYQNFSKSLGHPPFDFMPSNSQTINEYVPKNGDEIIIYFWDNEHKHTLLVVEAELLADEDKEVVRVIVHPQGNSFEEPVKFAMLIWKEIRSSLKKLDRRANSLKRGYTAVNTTNFYIGGDVKDSTVISGDENEVKK